MGNPEAIASSGNLLHIALEARSALTDVNLLHTLQDLGHPYGLILGQLFQTPSSQDVSNSSQSMSQLSQNRAVFESLSIPSQSYFGTLHEMAHDSTIYLFGQESSSAELLSEGLSSSSSSLGIYELFESSQPQHYPETTSHKIRLGTVSLNLSRYKGQETYIVKSPQGEPIAEIQPESPLAFLHLNRQREALRQKSPLERIQTMTKDLKEVFGLIDNPELFNSSKPEQQAVLTAAQSAVIVGISHLVPLFRRRTGLPFWKLDILPQAVQQLHRLDSQAVSNQFGGHRQVKVEDIEMTVITPQMRMQLVKATL